MRNTIILIVCLFLFGCASSYQLTLEDQIIDEECALKNSVPSIHDMVI